MPWHTRPFSWYITNLSDWRFRPFIFLLPPAIITGLFNKEKKQKAIVTYLTIVSLSYLLILSLVPDKLEWYDLPAYPLWALLIGIGVNELVKRIGFLKPRFPTWATSLFFIILLSVPAFFTYRKTREKTIPFEGEKPAYCLREIKKEFRKLKNLKVLLAVDNPLHELSVDFYRKAYKKEMNVSIQRFTTGIQINDTILYTQAFYADSLKRLLIRPDTIYVCREGVLAVIKYNRL